MLRSRFTTMVMRPVSLILLATAALGQTYTASTFAGVWLPENLPGTSVSLNQIGGVAVDAAGNVFLSLPQYSAVMRVDATTGILTRVAGNATNGFSGDNGPAVNAQLFSPQSLAIDSAGDLYIADTHNAHPQSLQRYHHHRRRQRHDWGRRRWRLRDERCLVLSKRTR